MAAAPPRFAWRSLASLVRIWRWRKPLTAEATLTPKNVNTATFGKLFAITDLNANVSGAVHNVVYACTPSSTDNSSCGVYAYDADTGKTL